MGNEHINPWLQIWTQPRKTMRSILDTDPKRLILWLAILGGILSGFSLILAIRNNTPHPQPNINVWSIVGLIILGVVLGIFHLYFGGWLYRLTGSWIGGKGNFTEVKSAVGWSNYPFIISSIIGILGFIFAQHPILKVIFGLLNFIVAIWGLVIFIKLLSEAHQFSAWKGLLAVLIALALIFVVVMAIALVIPLLTPLFQ